MYNDVERILISKDELKDRIKELGTLIEGNYKGKDLLMVGVLKGSIMFFTDLVREINIPVSLDFISASSYGSGTTSSKNVKLTKDLSFDIKGKNVIIVEDIVDSGYTLAYIKNLLLKREPASLKVCTLLDKKCRREVEFTPDYNGFDIDDYFVVGYGLDYNEKYRNLKEIGVLKPEIYNK